MESVSKVISNSNLHSLNTAEVPQNNDGNIADVASSISDINPDVPEKVDNSYEDDGIENMDAEMQTQSSESQCSALQDKEFCKTKEASEQDQADAGDKLVSDIDIESVSADRDVFANSKQGGLNSCNKLSDCKSFVDDKLNDSNNNEVGTFASESDADDKNVSLCDMHLNQDSHSDHELEENKVQLMSCNENSDVCNAVKDAPEFQNSNEVVEKTKAVESSKCESSDKKVEMELSNIDKEVTEVMVDEEQNVKNSNSRLIFDTEKSKEEKLNLHADDQNSNVVSDLEKLDEVVKLNLSVSNSDLSLISNNDKSDDEEVKLDLTINNSNSSLILCREKLDVSVEAKMNASVNNSNSTVSSDVEITNSNKELKLNVSVNDPDSSKVSDIGKAKEVDEKQIDVVCISDSENESKNPDKDHTREISECLQNILYKSNKLVNIKENATDINSTIQDSIEKDNLSNISVTPGKSSKKKVSKRKSVKKLCISVVKDATNSTESGESQQWTVSEVKDVQNSEDDSLVSSSRKSEASNKVSKASENADRISEVVLPEKALKKSSPKHEKEESMKSPQKTPRNRGKKPSSPVPTEGKSVPLTSVSNKEKVKKESYSPEAVIKPLKFGKKPSSPVSAEDKSVSLSPAPDKGKMKPKSYSSEGVIKPFKFGWMREVVHRAVVDKSKSKSDIYYFTPEGTKLRSMPEIGKYLTDHKNCNLTLENFTFAKETIYREPFETERSAKVKSTAISDSPVISNSSKSETKEKTVKRKAESVTVEESPVKRTSNRRQKVSLEKNELSSTDESIEAEVKEIKSKKSHVKEVEITEIKSKKNSVKESCSTPEPSVVKNTHKSIEKDTRRTKSTPRRSISKLKTSSESGATPPPSKKARVKFTFTKEVEDRLPRPCTSRCAAVSGQVPTIQCVMCLCLFHQQCIALSNKSAQYVCKPCMISSLEKCKVSYGTTVDGSRSTVNIVDGSDNSTFCDIPVSVLIPEVSVNLGPKYDLKSKTFDVNGTTVSCLPPPPPLKKAPDWSVQKLDNNSNQKKAFITTVTKSNNQINHVMPVLSPVNLVSQGNTFTSESNSSSNLNASSATSMPVPFAGIMRRGQTAAVSSVFNSQSNYSQVNYITSTSSIPTTKLINAQANNNSVSVVNSSAEMQKLVYDYSHFKSQEQNVSVQSENTIRDRTSASASSVPVVINKGSKGMMQAYGFVLSPHTSVALPNVIGNLNARPNISFSSNPAISSILLVRGRNQPRFLHPVSAFIPSSNTYVPFTRPNILPPQSAVNSVQYQSYSGSSDMLKNALESQQVKKIIRILPKPAETSEPSTLREMLTSGSETVKHLSDKNCDLESERDSVEDIIADHSDREKIEEKELCDKVKDHSDKAKVHSEPPLKELSNLTESICDKKSASQEKNLVSFGVGGSDSIVNKDEICYGTLDEDESSSDSTSTDDSVSSSTSTSSAEKDNYSVSQVFSSMNRLMAGYDCINLILKSLKVADLLSVTQVCRSWRHLASQKFLWEKVCLQGLHVTDWKKCAETLKKQRTKILDMRGLQHSDPEVTWRNFIQVLGDLKHIEHLIFGQVPPMVLNSVVGRLLRIKNLECYCLTETIKRPDMWEIPCLFNFSKLIFLRKIQRLKVRSAGGLEIFRDSLSNLHHLSELKHLSLTSLKSSPGDHFGFLTLLPKLISLELGECKTWGRKCFETLGKLKNLQQLRLESGGNLLDTSLPNALKQLTNLKELELMNYKIPKSLPDAVSQLQKLKVLSLWPNISVQAHLVNYNAFKTASKTSNLSYFCWGIISEDDSIPLLPILKEPSEEEENMIDSVIEEISFEDLFEKLCDLLPGSKVEMKCISEQLLNEYCCVQR